ncbi:hypothetical protein F4778DRAFT_96862 [Xylariomycetidae sp. FL2044]|nr:hypothetical protein F4778DRAFT_96862 [Xylariomycetidae sp. FL2044]
MAIQNEEERYQYQPLPTQQHWQKPPHWPAQAVASLQTTPPAVYQSQQPLTPAPRIPPTIVYPSPYQQPWIQLYLSHQTLTAYLRTYAAPRDDFLGNLPQDVLDRICSFTPYEDLFALRVASRGLYHMVKPLLALRETQISLVMRVERDFKRYRNGDTPGHGCYECSRVLPPSRFATNQPLSAALQPYYPSAAAATPGFYDGPDHDAGRNVFLRRFCINCGIASNIYRPGDLLTRKTEGNVWICNCRILWESEATSKCYRCYSSAPFRPMSNQAWDAILS